MHIHFKTWENGLQKRNLVPGTRIDGTLQQKIGKKHKNNNKTKHMENKLFFRFNFYSTNGKKVNNCNCNL